MKVLAGKIIGAAMFAAGVAAIWLWPKHKVEVSEADVAKAEAAYESAKTSYERYRNALGKGGVSKDDVTKAEASFKTARAQLAVAKKALESCTLVAPYDGTVADKYSEELLS